MVYPAVSLNKMHLHIYDWIYVRFLVRYRLAKIAEVKSKLSSAFRENLKSTGQSKFALDDKDQESVSS